jgi:hypothetical protein
MRHSLIKTAVRTMFACTGRAKALRQCESVLGRYLAPARGLSEEDGRRMVEVPWMPGIDEDMRRWSFFMILEHNAIVNRAITANVVQLACGEEPSGAAVIDVKNDVMPSASAGSEQVDAFALSVRQHVEAVEALLALRGTKTSLHPLFGPFDAHQWNCMFAFHLRLHLRQARFVVNNAACRQTPGAVL